MISVLGVVRSHQNLFFSSKQSPAVMKYLSFSTFDDEKTSLTLHPPTLPALFGFYIYLYPHYSLPYRKCQWLGLPFHGMKMWGWWWLLLYSAILHSQADSLHLHVILHEWHFSVFLNVHQSGVLTELAWLEPHETAAISARSVYTIQPCTTSLHAKPHM